ncbi:hypothetical protein PBRA_009203 [Plasmodiophora brassicae]|uniref:Integrase catalytic domain-containing protein n=1 Tax=Plasmodiophora brassicae TaxID=37360 RepID=A0A0G4J5Y3_PLABS|nr:hypothetical protein PBRA_009203 [Plasmodiophora brassicae]
MVNHCLTHGLAATDPTIIPPFCDDCAIAKAREQPYARTAKPKTWEILERIDFDECAPLPAPSLDGERYFITFTDHASRFKFTFLLHHQHEAFDRFRTLKTLIERQTGKLINVYADNAGEFLSTDFQAFLSAEGIEWQSIVAYSSRQNSVAERGHLTLMDAARAMLVHARLPQTFWGPAILTANHVHNVCPSPVDPTTTPHEQLRRSRADIRYLRTFGCDTFGFIPSQLRNKLSPRARKGIFICYAAHQKGYLLYHPDLDVTKVYRSVQFNEDGFGNRTAADALAEPTTTDDFTDPNYDPETPHKGTFLDTTPELHSETSEPIDVPDLCPLDSDNDGVDDSQTDAATDIPDCNTVPDDDDALSDSTSHGPRRSSRRLRKPVTHYGDPVHHGWINSIQLSCESGCLREPATYEKALASPDAE